MHDLLHLCQTGFVHLGSNPGPLCQWPNSWTSSPAGEHAVFCFHDLKAEYKPCVWDLMQPKFKYSPKLQIYNEKAGRLMSVINNETSYPFSFH